MAFSYNRTPLQDVLIFEPEVHKDSRGFFFESFNKSEFEKAVGNKFEFFQDNQSHSKRNVLRGLHYQITNPQGKLVRVTQGEVFDVCVDLRKESPSFGRSFSAILSAENKKQIWIPPRFAHGFLVLSDVADILYKTTDYWRPQNERVLLWSDAKLQIDWPLTDKKIISEKDLTGLPLNQCEIF